MESYILKIYLFIKSESSQEKMSILKKIKSGKFWVRLRNYIGK